MSIAAPFAACAILALLLDGTFGPFTFVPLIFALPGSVLLLNAGYGALNEWGLPLAQRYAGLVGIGGITGGVILGLPSPGNASTLGLGALYGFSTALCWIVLHALTRKWSNT